MSRGRVIVALWLCCIAITSVTPTRVAASDQTAPEIAARNAIVVDIATGEVLFAKAANERIAPASLTKLITALLAIELVPLNTRMTVSASDLVGEASMGLTDGETLTLNALLHGMLMTSGNDAALVVARESAALTSDSSWQSQQRFLDLANLRVAQLGLRDTHLENPHGLDEAGHYSTAHDLAAIALHITRTSPELVAIAGTPDWRGEGHDLENTNELLRRDRSIVAGKTGYTDDAGYCLVEIARRGDRTIVAVVLGSTADAWYADAANLLEFGFSVPITSGYEPPLGRITTQSEAPATSLLPTGFHATTTFRFDADTSLVTVTTPRNVGHWRTFVVAFVGFATLSLCLLLGLTGRELSPSSGRERRNARAGATPAVTIAPVWETQQIPWDGTAWGFGHDQFVSASHTGWTAALQTAGSPELPRAQDAAQVRRKAVIQPIASRRFPARRPNHD